MKALLGSVSRQPSSHSTATTVRKSVEPILPKDHTIKVVAPSFSISPAERLKQRLQMGKQALASKNFRLARENFEWVLKQKPTELAAIVALRWIAKREAR